MRRQEEGEPVDTRFNMRRQEEGEPVDARFNMRRQEEGEPVDALSRLSTPSQSTVAMARFTTRLLETGLSWEFAVPSIVSSPAPLGSLQTASVL